MNKYPGSCNNKLYTPLPRQLFAVCKLHSPASCYSLEAGDWSSCNWITSGGFVSCKILQSRFLWLLHPWNNNSWLLSYGSSEIILMLGTVAGYGAESWNNHSREYWRAELQTGIWISHLCMIVFFFILNARYTLMGSNGKQISITVKSSLLLYQFVRFYATLYLICCPTRPRQLLVAQEDSHF